MHRSCLASVVALLSLAASAGAQPFEWRTAEPESQGMSARQKLEALKEELARRKTHGFLVIRNDRIVYEWYAPGYGAAKKHGAASLSKPTVAGLALALLLGDGKLQASTRSSPTSFLPSLGDDDTCAANARSLRSGSSARTRRGWTTPRRPSSRTTS